MHCNVIDSDVVKAAASYILLCLKHLVRSFLPVFNRKKRNFECILDRRVTRSVEVNRLILLPDLNQSKRDQECLDIR